MLYLDVANDDKMFFTHKAVKRSKSLMKVVQWNKK